MHSPMHHSLALALCLGVVLFNSAAGSFIWRGSGIAAPKGWHSNSAIADVYKYIDANTDHLEPIYDQPYPVVSRNEEVIQPESGLENIYAVAIKALEELKSGPLCHQIAAVMLHNNCKLLEGKDDSAVRADTGRRMTDFVDSYAISLAICDLERGAFIIPPTCNKFTEVALRALSDADRPYLHVSTREIEECLAGMGKDPSAWNTWVSYKHKALMVCEAGRTDSNKAQSVLLYERLTKVVEQLVNGVERVMQRKVQHFDAKVQETSENLDKLNPQVDKIRAAIRRVENLLSREVEASINKSSEEINKGVQNAANLQGILSAMLKMVFDSNDNFRAAHEQSLSHVQRKADEGLDVFMNTVAAALSSSAALQSQIELSQIQSDKLAKRQEALQDGMEMLLIATEQVATKQNQQTYQLALASNITSDLLDTLETAVNSAASVNTSLLGKAGSQWWLYAVCPAVSLVMGSYGLPPSLFRNIRLVSLGEMVGFLISTYSPNSSILSTAVSYLSYSWPSPASSLFESGSQIMNGTELKV